MSEIKCWSCGMRMTWIERSNNDGFCPACGSEIDLESVIDALKSELRQKEKQIANAEAEG